MENKCSGIWVKQTGKVEPNNLFKITSWRFLEIRNRDTYREGGHRDMKYNDFLIDTTR